MSEPYGTLGATVPESDDYASGGADVPRAFREFSDSLGAGQGSGKFLIVPNTGAAAWKAMSGDVSINASGVTQIGNNKLATGMYQDASVTRGKLADIAKPIRWYDPLHIEGSQTRENTAYGTLATPDEIKEVLIPTGGGTLFIYYAALWENTKVGKGRAAIFIDNNQLQIVNGNAGGFSTTAAMGGSASSTGDRLISFPGGLLSTAGAGAYPAGAEWPSTNAAPYIFSTTAEAALRLEVGGTERELAKTAPYGGALIIPQVAAGTRTVSIRFKSAEGSVSAKYRHLMVGVLGNGA